MKIRIFALARELGLDSKVLLGLCDEAGVPLRNALATITPEEKEKIVAFINNRDGKGGAPEKKAESLAPTRDPNAGKVRDIQVLPSKASRDDVVVEVEEDETAESATVESEVEEESHDVSSDVVVAETPETEVSDDDDKDAASTPSETADASETEEEAEEPTEAASDDAPAPDTAESESEATPETPTPEVTPKAPQKASSPMQRMKSPTRREMKPIASVKEREQAAEQTREKEKPARRLVAAPPTYQAPIVKAKPKKQGEKAMKPDISLENIVDRSSLRTIYHYQGFLAAINRITCRTP